MNTPSPSNDWTAGAQAALKRAGEKAAREDAIYAEAAAKGIPLMRNPLNINEAFGITGLQNTQPPKQPKQ